MVAYSFHLQAKVRMKYWISYHQSGQEVVRKYVILSQTVGSLDCNNLYILIGTSVSWGMAVSLLLLVIFQSRKPRMRM